MAGYLSSAGSSPPSQEASRCNALDEPFECALAWTDIAFPAHRTRLLPQLTCRKAKVQSFEEGYSNNSRVEALTPRQRLRQLEPSWFLNGQTTSLFASETEKDDVNEERGGIVSVDPTIP